MNAKFWAAAVIAGSLMSGAVFGADDRSQDEVEAQLKAARQKLEDAAHEVADLSALLGKPLVDRLMSMGEGPGHAVIGVQLDAKDSKDGAHVRDVSPGGPAAEAGIRAGDVILSVNGTDVKVEHASAEVARLMRRVEPNSKVRIHLLRDGKPADFEVTARAVENAWDMPGMPPRPGVPPPPGVPFDSYPPGFPAGMHGSVAGMELATLTPQLGAYFGTDKGVLVLRAARNAAFGLQDGDVILSIDGREPSSGSHATRILASYQAGEKVKLQLMRQRKKMNLETLVPERHRSPPEPIAFEASGALSSACSLQALRCAAIRGIAAPAYRPLRATRVRTPPPSWGRTVLL
jgi:predicted metalloprotease with PDZ domain